MELKEAWHVHDDKVRDLALGVKIPGEEFGELVKGTRHLGRLLIRFSRVNRESQLDRQGTHESDTDHTVMLAVVACALSAKYLPELDIGRIAQHVLVHDLVEAYCGDTSTWHFESDFSAKEKAEADARLKMEREFPLFPWLHETINKYEQLADAEARFVKALDKAMPALLLNLNDVVRFENGEFRDPNRLQERIRGKGRWLREQPYARDERGGTHDEVAFAFAIRDALMEWAIARQWESTILERLVSLRPSSCASRRWENRVRQNTAAWPTRSCLQSQSTATFKL